MFGYKKFLPDVDKHLLPAAEELREADEREDVDDMEAHFICEGFSWSRRGDV